MTISIATDVNPTESFVKADGCCLSTPQFQSQGENDKERVIFITAIQRVVNKAQDSCFDDHQVILAGARFE